MHSLDKLPTGDPEMPTENGLPSESAPTDPIVSDIQPRSRRTSSVVKHKELCPKKETEMEAEARRK